LISPYTFDAANIDAKNILEKSWPTAGYDSSISVIGVPIPKETWRNADDAKDWNQYKKNMIQVENMLVERIKSLLYS
jgi:hypothetical protein